MKQSTAYTSTLPVEVMNQLNDYARKLKIPKNKLIEQAVNAYLSELKRQEYIHSFKRADSDEEQIDLAEQGLGDYLRHLEG
ncbi:MAG: ribbon-helix-helix domain-containing protein [Cytophagaceae bacterium]|nr:ribbon-helix-helix domain-containing protein [Cytophagaceae bacterium]